MDGDRAVDLAATAKETAERKLDLGGIPVRLRHAREDLGGVVEAVIDEVIETLELVARQAHGTRSAVAAPEEIGGEADQHEGQRQEHRRYFEHAPARLAGCVALRMTAAAPQGRRRTGLERLSRGSVDPARR